MDDSSDRRLSFSKDAEVDLRDPENQDADDGEDYIDNGSLEMEEIEEDEIENQIADATNQVRSRRVEIPPFPAYLNYVYNTKQDVPFHIYEKLKYQYLVIYNFLRSLSKRVHDRETLLASSSLMIIHKLSKSFKATVLEEQVLFPKDFLLQFCSYCDCMQLLGVTASARLRARPKHSKINRKSKLKIKNELMLSCVICGHVSRKAPGVQRGKPASEKLSEPAAISAQPVIPNKGGEDGKAKPVKGSTGLPASSAVSAVSRNTPATTNPSAQPTKPKGFSFLNSVSSIKSKPGAPSLKPASQPAPSLFSSSNEFVPFSSSSSALPSKNALKPQQTGSINLIELERLNKLSKKSKKKDDK